jgi:membrane-associated phospholipid phosphatase
MRPHRPIEYTTSPIDKPGAGIMAVTAIVGIAVTTLVGLALVEWWGLSRFGRADIDLSVWLEEHRTETLTAVTERISMASDTLTKVLLAAALIPVFLWLFRRWHEWALIVGGLVIEVTIYGVAARIVQRDRPPVEQLDGSPSGISFPSGHIAAATVFYGGLAIVIFMQTRRTWPRVIASIVGVGVPIAMVWARLYLGMHFLTDAIAGLLIGVTVLVVMHYVVHRTLSEDESPELHDAVARQALGLTVDA